MKRKRPKIKTSFIETSITDVLSVSKTTSLKACFIKKETHLNKSLVTIQIKNKIEEVA